MTHRDIKLYMNFLCHDILMEMTSLNHVIMDGHGMCMQVSLYHYRHSKQ